MSATPHAGPSGTTLRLGATSYTVTNIVISYADPNADAEKIDVSHLGLTTGAQVKTIDRPLQGSVSDTGRSVQFDYLGTDIIADASTGTCNIVTGAVTVFSAVAYTVSASTLTFATQDAIRGQATIRIART